MENIKSIFFAAGGVFLPRLYFAAIQLLESLGAVVTDRARQEINRLETGRLTGAILDDLFLTRLASCAGLTERLTMDHLGAIFKMDPFWEDLLRELAAVKELVLFSDYPASWLVKANPAASFMSLFDRVIYLEALNCSNSNADALERLISSYTLKAGQSLWVDGDAQRTALALRSGIESIIYVDEHRLRRDLRLAGVL